MDCKFYNIPLNNYKTFSEYKSDIVKYILRNLYHTYMLIIEMVDLLSNGKYYNLQTEVLSQITSYLVGVEWEGHVV